MAKVPVSLTVVLTTVWLFHLYQLCCKLLQNYSVITAYLVDYCRLGSNGGYWPFNITVFWKVIRQEYVNVDSVTFWFSTVITWFRCSNYTDRLPLKNTDRPWQQAGCEPDSQYLSKYCLFFYPRWAPSSLSPRAHVDMLRSERDRKTTVFSLPREHGLGKQDTFKVLVRKLIYFYSNTKKLIANN